MSSSTVGQSVRRLNKDSVTGNMSRSEHWTAAPRDDTFHTAPPLILAADLFPFSWMFSVTFAEILFFKFLLFVFNGLFVGRLNKAR